MKLALSLLFVIMAPFLAGFLPFVVLVEAGLISISAGVTSAIIYTILWIVIKSNVTLSLG